MKHRKTPLRQKDDTQVSDELDYLSDKRRRADRRTKKFVKKTVRHDSVKSFRYDYEEDL